VFSNEEGLSYRDQGSVLARVESARVLAGDESPTSIIASEDPCVRRPCGGPRVLHCSACDRTHQDLALVHSGA